MNSLAGRLRKALYTLQWSAQRFARLIDGDPRLVQRWLSAERGYTPPEEIVAWAEAHAEYLQTNPAPEWKRHPDRDRPITRERLQNA